MTKDAPSVSYECHCSTGTGWPLRYFVLATLCLFGTGCSTLQERQQQMENETRTQIRTRVQALQKRARAGNVDAQIGLGRLVSGNYEALSGEAPDDELRWN